MVGQLSLMTGNAGKVREYAEILGVEVTAVDARIAEVQSLDVAEVVRRKAADAYALIGGPVLVDDTGLSLDAWNGLSGAGAPLITRYSILGALTVTRSAPFTRSSRQLQG
jgi:inosine/xanthosine triphosphate pyrophosphatase family protein